MMGFLYKPHVVIDILQSEYMLINLKMDIVHLKNQFEKAGNTN
jgi:hypothetical protein